MMDFFGGSFGKALIGKGLSAAFGSGKDPQGSPHYSGPDYSPFRVHGLDMAINYKSPHAINFKAPEAANYDLTLAMWNKRLFGNESYTNIEIPRLK